MFIQGEDQPVKVFSHWHSSRPTNLYFCVVASSEKENVNKDSCHIMESLRDFDKRDFDKRASFSETGLSDLKTATTRLLWKSQ